MKKIISLSKTHIPALAALSLAIAALFPGSAAAGPTLADNETTQMLSAANKTKKPAKASSSSSNKKTVVPDRQSRRYHTQPIRAGGQSDVIYKILLAELALQNFQFELASRLYTELAITTGDDQAFQRAIEIAIFSQKIDLAIDLAGEWANTRPDSTQALQTMIALLLVLERLDEAEPYLAKLLALEPERLGDNFKELIRTFARQPDREAVLRIVTSLARPYPNLPETHLVIASVAKSANQPDLAMQEIDEALRLNPDWDTAAIYKAQLLNDRSSDQAIVWLEQYTQTHSDSYETEVFLARLLFTKERYVEARQHYLKLLKNHPDNPEIVFPIAILALEQNDLEIAEKQFRHLLSLDFRDKNMIRYYLGLIAENQKKPNDAKFFFDSVSDGNYYVTSKRKYALLLVKEGRVEEARRYLQDSPAPSTEIRIKLILAEAAVLHEAGQTGNALALIEQALTAQPNSQDLLYDGAMMAERMKRYDLSDNWLKHLIEINPQHAHALNALAYSYIERGISLDAAGELLDSALAIAPNDPYILDSKGWLLYTQGNLEAALVELQRAYAILADSEIAAHIGEVLWHLGRKDEAKKIWDEGSKLNPNSEALVEMRAKYKP